MWGVTLARSSGAEIRRAIGRIQRLCCLGLGGQALMPALMTALQEMVPASNRQFYWPDLRMEIANCYLEGPGADFLALYLGEFYHGRERDVRMTFPEIMRTRYPSAAGDIFPRCFRVEWSEFLRSEYYNVLRRPCGMMHGALFKLTEGGRPVGVFHFFRSSDEPVFTQREFAILDALHDFVAHGLHQGLSEDVFTDTEDRALVVVNPAGQILHRTSDAHRLLYMALLPRWAAETTRRARLDQPPQLACLCKALTATFSGDLPAEAPVLRIRNDWGEFVLRAYWLNPSHPQEPSRFIGVTIERREPKSLGLVRRVEGLPLTEREKQLCLLLARGHDTVNAARAMGVAEHTVITHRRHLYHKLGVSNRLTLIDRLHPE